MGKPRGITKENAVQMALKGQAKAIEGRRKAAARRRHLRELLTEFLASPVDSNPSFARFAAELGIPNDASISFLFIVSCCLNSIAKGKIDDIETMMKLLGETTEKVEVRAEIDNLAHSLFSTDKAKGSSTNA